MLKKLLSLFKFFDITKMVDGIKQVYLRRYFILGNNVSEWGRVFLHKFFRPDDDRDPHSHPWTFLTIVLKGGYTDERWEAAENPKRRIGPFYEKLRAGSIRLRKPTHVHRVRDVLPNTWTLVITGPKVQNWGFFDENWIEIPWRKYLNIPDDAVYEGD